MLDRSRPWNAHARQALDMAREAAWRRQQERVGTEHLLVGLNDHGSVACALLRHQGIDEERLRSAVERELRRGASEGAEPVTSSENLRRALERAEAEACDLGHHTVGTEHLLLGLLRVPGCAAHRILMALGCNPERLRREALSFLGVVWGRGEAAERRNGR